MIFVNCDHRSGYNFSLINFNYISLHNLLKYFSLPNIFSLEPIVPLFQPIDPSTPDNTATKSKGLADASEHLHFGLGRLLCEPSQLVSADDDVLALFVQDESFECLGHSELEDKERDDHKSSYDHIIDFDLIVVDFVIGPQP